MHAALLAAGGARVDVAAVAGAGDGFAGAFGVATSVATLDAMTTGLDGAAGENWIKAYPCCLQTHAAIDAALALGSPPDGRIVVAVHPLSRQAAALDAVRDGLQAKFSIPYLTAYVLLRGRARARPRSTRRPRRRRAGRAHRGAHRSRPRTATKPASRSTARSVARVSAPRGSPANPLDAAALAVKVRSLAGDALDGALEDPERPAAELLRAVLGTPARVRRPPGAPSTP